MTGRRASAIWESNRKMERALQPLSIGSKGCDDETEELAGVASSNNFTPSLNSADIEQSFEAM